MKIPPLLVPWLGWSPFVFSGILAQLVMMASQRPDLALPLTSFSFMLLLFLIYATLIVAAFYRDSLSTTAQLRIFNLQEGELPRIVQVPWTLASRISTAARNRTPATGSSARPLHVDSRSFSDMGRRLQEAYGRFITVARLNRNKTANIPPERY